MVAIVQSLKSDLLNRKSRKEVSKRKNQLQQITTSPPFSLPHPARNKMVSGRESIDPSRGRFNRPLIVAPHRLNLLLDRTILRHDSLRNPSSSSSVSLPPLSTIKRWLHPGNENWVTSQNPLTRPHHREISPWRTIGFIRGRFENQHGDLDLI